MRPIALALALVTLPATAVAYPISPVPLWELVQRSPHIVVAKVERIEEREREGDENRWERAVAHLSVLETWRGADEKRIEVTFSNTMICPAPPRYEPGKIVLAFLTVGEKGYRTVALSYGTLYPSEEDLAVYRELVGDAIRLQEASPMPEDAHRKWLIRASSRRVTRWDGLYTLIPESDELHSFYDGSGRRSLALSLKADEAKNIAEGFVAEPSTDRTLVMTLALLRGYRSRSFDAAVVSATAAVLQRERLPWWASDAVALTLERLGLDAGSEPSALAERVPESDVRARWESGRSRWERLAKPIEERNPAVWGVGANTPD